MYRIIDGRGSGKTSRLLLLAKENNATVVCANPKAMEAKAHAYGLVGINFISYREAIDKQQYNDDKYTHKVYECFLIDEIENFAKAVLGMNGPLEGYTLSNED